MSRERVMLSRRLLAPALCVIAGAVTACGAPEPAPELVTGTAPTGQQPVALNDYRPWSVADGDEWPRACELITDAEVLAVLPQAAKPRREPAAGRFDYRLVGLGTNETPQAPRDNPQAAPRRISIPEQECKITTNLPSDDEEGVYATVDVRIDMVGSPDTVHYFFSAPSERGDLPDRFGADECHEELAGDVPNVSTFSCRKGRMSIELTGVIQELDEDVHLRLPGDPANSAPGAVYDWYRTRVMPQLVGVAARRMP